MALSTHDLFRAQGMDSTDDSDSHYFNKEGMVFGDDTFKFPMTNLNYQFNSGMYSIFLADLTHWDFNVKKAKSTCHIRKSSYNCFLLGLPGGITCS